MAHFIRRLFVATQDSSLNGSIISAESPDDQSSLPPSGISVSGLEESGSFETSMSVSTSGMTFSQSLTESTISVPEEKTTEQMLQQIINNCILTKIKIHLKR